MTKEIADSQSDKGKYTGQNCMPGARGSLLHGLLRLVHHHRGCHLTLLLAFPILLHWRHRSPDIGGLQEVEYRWAAPLIRQKVTHAPLLLPLFRRLLDPSPHFRLLVLPPVTVLQQLVPPL